MWLGDGGLENLSRARTSCKGPLSPLACRRHALSARALAVRPLPFIITRLVDGARVAVHGDVADMLSIEFGTTSAVFSAGRDWRAQRGAACLLPWSDPQVL